MLFHGAKYWAQVGFLVVGHSGQTFDWKQMDGCVLDAWILAVYHSPRGFDVRILSLVRPRMIFALLLVRPRSCDSSASR